MWHFNSLVEDLLRGCWYLTNRAIIGKVKLKNRVGCFQRDITKNAKKKQSKITQIQGCFRASNAVIRFDGFTVSIWLIKFFASGVTVSHSGEGYCHKNKQMIW